MNNSQVCHNWANQTKTQGKGSNLFFEGNKIYSYGHHFCAGVIYEENYLICANNYSPSTNRHLSFIRRACPKNPIYLYGVESCYTPYDTNTINLKDILTSEIKLAWLEFNENIAKVARARTSNPLAKCVSMIENISKAMNLLDAPLDQNARNDFSELSTLVFSANIKDYSNKENEKAKQLKAQKIIDWKAGKGVSLNFLDYALIRLNNGFIETSLGLKFCPVLCKRFFENADKAQIGQTFEGYTILENNDKILKIGCHTFRKSDFASFAKILNEGK